MSSTSPTRLTRSTSREASKAEATAAAAAAAIEQQKPVAATTMLERTSSDSTDIKALLDKMFRSTDTVTEHLKDDIFKSNESGILRDLLKSSHSTPGEIFEAVLPSLSSSLSADLSAFQGATTTTAATSSDRASFLSSSDALLMVFKTVDTSSTLSSSDALSMLFKTGDTSSFDRDLVDSVLFSNYLKSTDRTKSTDTALIRSVSTSIMNDKLPSDISSRDWMPADVARHIDQDVVEKLMLSDSSGKPKTDFPNFLASGASQGATTSGTPRGKKKTNFYELYKRGMSGPSSKALKSDVATKPSPPPAAGRAEVAHANPRSAVSLAAAAATAAASKPKQATTISTKKPTKKRKRKVHEPDVKEFVTVTDQDVLLGRGGLAHHHPGNKVYLKQKDRMQARYMAAEKTEKTAISQELVDFVNNRGGRFLKQDKGGTKEWYVVLNITARKKASQALREINTPEERAKKREKYPKK